MKVDAPAFYALVPVNDTLVVEGGPWVYDQMSGASPLYFNVLSGASIGDYRTAGDVKVTKYFGNAAVSVGGFVSSEQDFCRAAARSASSSSARTATARG
jgi:hypothetical protein